MNNQELEQEILANIPITDGISKSDLFRKLKTDKSSMLSACNHLIDLGYIAQETQGNKHILTRIDTKNDIETFNSVMKWQNDLLVESVKKLNTHKELFKVKKHKRPPKPPVYKPINEKIHQDLIHFSMGIDYLMQHSNKYNYAKIIKTITEKDANFRINKIEEMLHKSISQVFEKHKNDKVALTWWIKKVQRTWNVFL